MKPVVAVLVPYREDLHLMVFAHRLMLIRVHQGSISVRQVLRREWGNLRAQLVGLRALRGRFSVRGYLVLFHSSLRVTLAAAGIRRR